MYPKRFEGVGHFLTQEEMTADCVNKGAEGASCPTPSYCTAQADFGSPSPLVEMLQSEYFIELDGEEIDALSMPCGRSQCYALDSLGQLTGIYELHLLSARIQAAAIVQEHQPDI